ncbi:hypothetical protein SOVF_033820, partial [Spinacia oleracea]
YSHLLYEMKNASWTAQESSARITSFWRVLEIWVYEHFPCLTPARPGVATYPFSSSWEGAVRTRVTLATFRRALRVFSLQRGGRFVPLDPPESMLAKTVDVTRVYAEAVEAGGESICLPWENFVDRRASYEDLMLRLAPPVRFVPPAEEIDPEDVPYADRFLGYMDPDGEQMECVVVTVVVYLCRLFQVHCLLPCFFLVAGSTVTCAAVFVLPAAPPCSC